MVGKCLQDSCGGLEMDLRLGSCSWRKIRVVRSGLILAIAFVGSTKAITKISPNQERGYYWGLVIRGYMTFEEKPYLSGLMIVAAEDRF